MTTTAAAADCRLPEAQLRPAAPDRIVTMAAAAPLPGPAGAAAIQALDPLRGDETLARLPEMNARADTGALEDLARKLLPAETAAGAFSVAECIAAMRDLGIVAGSIKRHGTDPIRALPALEPVMAGLGRRSGMIARDTLYHYTEWNPPGARRRTYTGGRQEHLLQDSVRLCLPHLRAAVDQCRHLKAIAVTDREFAMHAAQLARHLRGYVAAFNLTWENVDPDHFALVLRPYFEEYTVGGEVLLGPAASHLPLGLIDLALWASDSGAGRQAGFRAEAARYSPAPWRRLYAEWATGPSLVTRVLEAAGPRQGAGSWLQADPGAAALRDTLRALVTFRGRHVILGRRAYRQGVGLYTLGSGGGSLDLLSEILGLTRLNAALLRRASSDG